MKDLKQKVAYLQGLADGLEVKDTKEGKVISEILKVLCDVADSLEAIRAEQDDMSEYLENIDSDLGDVEEIVFGDEDEDEDDDECCSCEDEDLIDVECPNCHETVCFDASILDDDDLIEVTCPVCDAVVFSNGEEYQLEKRDDNEDSDEE